jgi:rubrerythrin
VVTGSLAAAAGVVLASCGGSDSKSRSVATVSTTEAESDAAVLGALLDQEQSSIAAYSLLGTKLHGRALVAARRFVSHERSHADALARAIGRLGASPAPPRPQSEYAAGFPKLRAQRDALSFALDVETTAVAAYADALGKLATDSARVMAASILTTESEHAAVLLGDLGRPQVPEPFVTGPPPSGDEP